MACSKYLEDKFRKIFHFFDVNKDGVLTREDFDQIGQVILHTYEAGDKHGTKMQQMITQILWPVFEPLAKDGKIDEDTYVKARKTLYESNFAKYRHGVMTFANILFSIFDRNDDGMMSEDEFQHWYSSFNVKNKETVTNVFKQLDIDGDGNLTQGEVLVAIVNYFTCNDPVVGYAFLFDFM